MVYINGCPFVLREEVGLVMPPKPRRGDQDDCVHEDGCPCTWCDLFTPIGRQVRPLKNMMEYAGIEAARIEAMEERLKKDVVAEVRQLRH